MILNRTDVKGEWANPLAALIAALLVNAVIFGLGVVPPSMPYPNVIFEPPPWVVAAIWLAIFPMWGMARWHALRAGRDGRRAAWVIVAMMIWSLAYPAVTGGFDLYKSAAANAISLVVVGYACLRARAVSRTAALWIAPSLVWVAFANLLTLAKIANLEM